MKQERIYRGDYIKGTFLKVTDAHGEVLSKNPGDLDQPQISVPFNYEHVGEAVGAACVGFRSWKLLATSDRYAAVSRYLDTLKERTKSLAEILAFEGGRPLWEATAEINETANLIEYFLELPSETEREKSVSVSESTTGTYRFLPRGVMAVISPSTLPVAISHSQFIPALLNGNTVVLKSSKFNPMVGQALAEIANDSGLPSGIFNVVHGNAELSRRLITHKEVQGVFFTGSHEKGLRIRKEIISDYWKLLVLHSGGKNGMVIWEDANYEKALRESLYAAYVTTGQRYTSARNIIVHSSLFDKFLKDFHALSKKVRVDFGLDPKRSPFMGSLVSEAKMENYLRYQGIAVREGCEEIMRGKHLEKKHRGFYVSPSIHYVTELKPKSIYQNEMFFGPNVAVYQVKELEEAAAILNQTNDGLVASMYSGSRDLYRKLLEQVDVGLFHWNCPTVAPTYRLPYLGIKQSGNNRPMGLHAYLQCTYPVSSLEMGAEENCLELPETMPKLKS